MHRIHVLFHDVKCQSYRAEKKDTAFAFLSSAPAGGTHLTLSALALPEDGKQGSCSIPMGERKEAVAPKHAIARVNNFVNLRGGNHAARSLTGLTRPVGWHAVGRPP